MKEIKLFSPQFTLQASAGRNVFAHVESNGKEKAVDRNDLCRSSAAATQNTDQISSNI